MTTAQIGKSDVRASPGKRVVAWHAEAERATAGSVRGDRLATVRTVAIEKPDRQPWGP